MVPKKSDQRVQVFVSYSHADRQWLDRLNVHLAPLAVDYEIATWSDKRIRPGSKWREEIRAAVEKASVAVLLISADFLASDFVRTNELPPLLKAAEEEGTLILPVIVSPSLFLRKPELSQFQAVNDPAAPLLSVSEGEREGAFLKVAEAILERVAVAREASEERPSDQSEKREAFLEHATWTRLIKIGDWIFDEDGGRIIGSGVHAYLLSRGQYGDAPFVIHASLEFSNFDRPGDTHGLGMNAGIVFGWQHEKQSPRYYNIKLSGEDLQVERVGFGGDEAYRAFEHITRPSPLKIVSGVSTDFAVRVDSKRIDIFADGRLAESIERPTGVVGRVGLRPWRSKMDCMRYVVSEEEAAVEQLHAADGASHRS